MTDRALALGNTLLTLHRDTCRSFARCAPDAISDGAVNERTIRYQRLYERAGVPFPGRNSGPPLAEIAQWCVENQYPPLHALAVNETGKPGFNYDQTPGWPDRCSLDNWHSDVRRCIAFDGYPEHI